ncbi:MAG: DmsC/YnfH family molybdoenzyme membrane anchor subunit [Pseudomonadota bacterium]
MHPALSVILFSTASGAGYGLLIFVVLGRLLWLPSDSTALVWGFVLSLVLIVGGLLSSTFHLGRPERSWRAFSQWRTSWLSREGVMAIVTFAPMAGLVWHWFARPNDELLLLVAGVFAMVGALVTVFTTSMIYASLKPIPAWSNPWTSAVYLLFALMTGGLLYYILVSWLTQNQNLILVELTIGLILSGALVKLLYWRHVSSDVSSTTPESATGLGQLGKVSQLQAPHSQENYLLKEMGFKIARKHGQRLKWICFFTAFVAPVSVMLLALFVQGLAMKLLLLSALASMAIGVFIERWLFFAEAKHVVTHYYHEARYQ